ncbi:MAG TPA: hypothetical protein QGH18_01990, partial [Arenicellales bacterium]|nr:hypothetical protein [Arenicellales bacterium]
MERTETISRLGGAPFPTASRDPVRYGFLLLPEYTMIAFAAAIEPLRMANRVSSCTLYEFPLFSI